jgi:nitrogen regulatory protein P-II 1
MKKIVAIFPPSKLDDLKKAVVHPWIGGLTVSESKGHGRQKGHTEVYRGSEYRVDFVPKLKVEIVVPDPVAPRVLHDLERLLRTGKIGDGKIFVVPVEEAVRIRTGERGETAL